ncbi:unnamed protein product [marine sediment metagenome]|uniref:Uncharacterized protein n=1 Tax=marine sediment metagenome TaxID=412755 RepID=X0S2T3_9ZZZZ
MAAVAIVATAVTAQHVAAIQTMCVVQIQVLIAANLVKLVVRGIVVILALNSVLVVIAYAFNAGLINGKRLKLRNATVMMDVQIITDIRMVAIYVLLPGQVKVDGVNVSLRKKLQEYVTTVIQTGISASWSTALHSTAYAQWFVLLL